MKTFNTFDHPERMTPCRKKPITVHSKQINEPFRVKSLEGDYKQGKPGDYLMRGVDGELYICDKAIYEKTYDDLPVSYGRFDLVGNCWDCFNFVQVEERNLGLSGAMVIEALRRAKISDIHCGWLRGIFNNIMEKEEKALSNDQILFVKNPNICFDLDWEKNTVTISKW